MQSPTDPSDPLDSPAAEARARECTEQLRQRSALAQTYMTEIAHNPFALETDESLLAARREAARARGKLAAARKRVPVMDRVDNQARTAYLNLQNQVPGTLPPVLASPGYSRSPQQDSLTEGEPPVSQELLARYAPVTTSRYANLTEEDQKFLSGIYRRYGPRQKADDYVKQQKEIFLMELSDQTKLREIDQLSYQARKRDRALGAQQAGLDYQITQLDRQIRKADQGTAQLVQQLEQAAEARRRRQDAVDQLQSLLIVQKSELNRLLGEWDKFHTFQKLVEDLLQKIPDETDLLRRRQEAQEAAIHACIAEFHTADGLCLDCLTFNNGSNSKSFAPEGWELLEEVEEGKCELSEAGIVCGRYRVSGGPCTHKQVIRYVDIYANPRLDEEAKFLSEGPDFAEVEEVLRDGNYLEAGKSVAGEVLSSIYLKHASSIQYCSIYQLMDSLKHLEQHNFQMVEQIQDLETQKQLLSQQIIREQKDAERILQTQEQEIAQISVKLQDRTAEKREEKVREVLEYATRAQQQNQQLLQSICEAYVLASGLAKEEAQSIGALSQLSQMEQRLESLAAECARRFTEQRQRHFEKACERQRQKQVYQRLKREEEALRAEKVEKQLEKNRRPLRATDERRVVHPGAFTLPRRPLKSLAQQGAEVQLVDENFYDLQEMRWVDGVGWRPIGAE